MYWLCFSSQGVTVHGRVLLPDDFNQTFSSKSCLTVKAQEYRLCGGEINCINPLHAKETFHNLQLEDNVIPYAITLPNIGSGHILISAILNVDWCRDDVKSVTEEWIRNGDYHNEETHDFMIPEKTDQFEKDIEMTEYMEVVTGTHLIYLLIETPVHTFYIEQKSIKNM